MIFQPTMGHNRSTMLQQAAQSAAQNVMRRNKLRSLIGGATGAGGGGASMGSPIHAAALGKPIGTAGGISRPAAALGGQTLAQQLAAAAGAAQIPGAYNPSGGGADFSSVPDPADGHQSPQTLPNQGVVPTSAPGFIAPQPVAGTGTPGGYAAPPPPAGTPGYVSPPQGGAPSYIPSPIMGGGATQQVVAPGVVSGTGTPSVGSPGAGVNPGGGMIPLGGNLFYDPATDSVVGPPGTPGNAGGAARAS